MKMRLSVVIVLNLFLMVCCQETKEKSWKDKDIMDMSDADMERLLDQWEENDEPLEPDELPEHLRPPPQIDFTQFDTSNPDNILRMTKMGKSVMMFVDVREEISSHDSDEILRLWQGSLQNNHIVAERYPIESRRAVFMFREGSQAVDAKAFLLKQPELEHLTLEGQVFYGINSKKNPEKSKNEL